ncbi:hypothetical protein F2Q70_00031034 [Brassica cretica]|uniref:Uncharacterized protein n=1 Tax=Brassica cretica TaxID=69181 RepID=A0A8S9FMY4_BRACR|nr:hypothetical protein F2Q70_00031034 [Brassica cretica]
MFGHIGRSPSFDVGTTGPMPYRQDYECETRPCKACFGMDLCFLGLVFSGFKETPYSLDREDSDRRGHSLWLSITRRCNVAMTRRTVGYRAVTRWIVLTLSPKSGLGTESGLVAGRGDLTEIANSRSWGKFCDSDRIVPSPSCSASGPWRWVGWQSCSCLIVGWPVGSFISNSGVGRSIGHVLV